jgi:hypothetical protein
MINIKYVSKITGKEKQIYHKSEPKNIIYKSKRENRKLNAAPGVSPEGSFVQLRYYKCQVKITRHSYHVANLEKKILQILTNLNMERKTKAYSMIRK